MSLRRYMPGAQQRALAILGALALLLSALPLVGTAAADEHLQDPHSRGIDEACALVDLEDHDFDDLAGFGDEAQQAIRCAAAYGIAQGYDADTYRPGLDIQRYQMALFLQRLAAHVADTSDVELPDVEDQGFTDVGGLPDGHQDAINLLGTLGVTTGTGDGTTFSPHAAVSRRDMASFLVRLQNNLIEEGSYETEDAFFPDVTDALGRAGDINAIAERGIAAGHVDGSFRPFDSVRRAEMALFVMRHVDENVAAGRIPGLVPTTDVTILHDTHLHGTYGDEDGPNIGQYMALAEERKDARDNALFVGNGDDMAPSLLSGLFRGQHMIDVFNESPLDVNTFGNHEFDYGPDQLRDLIGESDFPWVTANVVDTSIGEPFAADLGVESYIMEEFDGVNVGITGVGPRGMATITSMGDETEQISDIDALESLVPEMREAGADIVVVASHLTNDNARELAAEVDGIDVIVGDHGSEVLDEPEVVNDTIVAFVGDEFDHLGELTLRTIDSEIVRWHHTRHDLADMDIDAHPAVQTIVDDYNEELDAELNVVIGQRDVTWDTRRAVVRNNETAIGNFITDSMREHHDADIAVQNSGGIRADEEFPPGDITRRDIAEILPFDNYVVLAEIEGWVIEDMLEHSVSDFPDSDGRFLQVSGIEMEFDATRDVGDRVTELTVNGEQVDENETYTIATNDFTLGGGDAFDMLAEEADVIVGADGGPLLSAFMMEVVEDREGDPVTTDVEGRIIRLDD